MSEEPVFLKILLDKKQEMKCLQQIFFMQKDILNNTSYAWQVFAIDRDVNNKKNRKSGFLIRHVVWDKITDQDRISNTPLDEKTEILESWPTIDTYNYWVNAKDSKKIISLINTFDKHIENGIVLTDTKTNDQDWKDIQIRRVYDWGSRRVIWGPAKENTEIQTLMEEFNISMQQIVDNIDYTVDTINLDYSIMPNVYKDSIVNGL